MTKRVVILLDDATHAALVERQSETGATMSGQIKVAIRQWLAASQGIVADVQMREEF